MYEIIFENLNIPLASVVFATNNSFDSFLWTFLFIMLFVCGIVLSIFLIVFSTKPKDWKHESFSEDFPPGRLDVCAKDIDSQVSDYQQYSRLKNNIEMLFFEKLRLVYGLTQEHVYDMKQRTPKALTNLIKDDEISDFIFNTNQKYGRKGFLSRSKSNKKEMFLVELNKILDKMEAWGE